MRFSFLALLLFCSVQKLFSQIIPGHEGKLLNSFGDPPYLKGSLSVAVSGNFAYVGSFNATGALEIVDITNINVPVHKGSLKDGEGGALLSGPRNVTIVGNYAYIVSESGRGFEIVDISDPANPRHKGSLKDGGGSAPYLSHPIGLAVSGNYAFVCDYFGNALEIIDVSNPAAPVHKASIHDGGGVAPYLNQAYDVEVVGNYAYVVSRLSHSLEIIDITDPAQPVHAGGILNGTNGAKIQAPRGVFIHGNYALIASSNSNALEIVDITNPANPTHVGSLSNGVGGAKLQTPFSVAASGNYAYVSSYGSNAVEVVDITNPSAPTHKGSLTHGTGGAMLEGGWNLALSGNKVFVATNISHALEIIDVSNPAAPTHTAALTTGPSTAPFLDHAGAIQTSSVYAYVASTNSNAFQIVDKSNPASPVGKGSLVDGKGSAPYLNNPVSISVVGSLAYVGSTNAFEIIDISNPVNPIHKGALLGGGGIAVPHLALPYGLVVSGNYAYVTDQINSALEIIDVTNPAAPVSKGRYIQSGAGFTGQPTGLAVRGNYAYIADYNGALDVVDVSNPASPQQVSVLSDGNGSAPYLMGAWSIYLSGDYAYIACSFGNSVEIVDISDPLNPTHKGSLLDGGGSAPFLNNPTSIYVQGNYAYVASGGSSALEVIDVSDPANPVHYKALLDGDGGAFMNGPIAAVPSGNYVYVTTENALEVVYLFYPSVTSFSPTIGNPGTTIDITGSNFNTNMIVKFGDATGTVSNITATTAKVVVPASAKIGKMTVSVDGHVISSSDEFVVSPTASDATNLLPTGFVANWSDVNASGYFLDVSADNFATFVDGYDNRSVGNVTTFTITGLNPATGYKYRLTSSNGSVTSTNSNVVTVLTTPAVPQANAATASTQTTFTANWNSVAGATSYYLDVASNESFSTASILADYKNRLVSTNAQEVTGLTAATTYYYRVRSANASGSSPSSNTTTALTTPANPANLSVTQINQTSFTANWSAVNGATGYFVDAAVDNSFASLLPGYNNKAVNDVSISITGLTTNTIYYVRVRSANTSGASGNSTVLSALTLPPTPTAGPADLSPTQTSFSAKWGSVAGATGYNLTVASDATFGPHILANYNNQAVGNVTSFSINNGLVPGTTYYYRVSASNASGSSPASNVIQVTTLGSSGNSAVTYDVLFPTGGTVNDYRIVSVPQLKETKLTTGLSEGSFQKNWRIQRYDPAQTKNVDILDITKLSPGNGYWINSNLNPAPSIHVVGTDQPETATITLQPGWNQVGNPFYSFNVSWTDVLARNSSVTGVGNLYTYNVPTVSSAQPFQQYDGLLTWGGGFVNSTNTSAVSLTIPVSVARFNGRKTPPANAIVSSDLSGDEWFVPMTFQVGNNTNNLGGFGMHPQANTGIDRYDAIALPRFFTYVEFSSNHPEFFQPSFMRDVAPTSGSYEWRFSTSTNSDEHEASLSWNNTAFGNSNAKLLLFDEATGAMIDMRRSNNYTFQMNTDHSILVFFSANGELHPTITSVGQPFPNPFSSRVTVPFITSNANENVQFILYDMMGKSVRTLINDRFEPGYHEASWDGGDDQGNTVSPGMYVYLFSGTNSPGKSGKIILK
ncbi:MAG TPA: fibronectin type III domain-containing protein [Cyclobacteriaceae bacterium]|nr:fibronectin type III domain-containing protein [Cyclobacteriaceae bacterium]